MLPSPTGHAAPAAVGCSLPLQVASAPGSAAATAAGLAARVTAKAPTSKAAVRNQSARNWSSVPLPALGEAIARGGVRAIDEPHPDRSARDGMAGGGQREVHIGRKTRARTERCVGLSESQYKLEDLSSGHAGSNRLVGTRDHSRGDRPAAIEGTISTSAVPTTSAPPHAAVTGRSRAGAQRHRGERARGERARSWDRDVQQHAAVPPRQRGRGDRPLRGEPRIGRGRDILWSGKAPDGETFDKEHVAAVEVSFGLTEGVASRVAVAVDEIEAVELNAKSTPLAENEGDCAPTVIGLQ